MTAVPQVGGVLTTHNGVCALSGDRAQPPFAGVGAGLALAA
jgi:hypothetical protein